MFDILILIVAGLAAGVLNAIAGGGTFLTLPALIAVGVPPVSANATATLTALPGYVSSAWGFRHDMQAEGALSLKAIAVVSVVGGLAGALLLIVTPGDTFLWIVPWLLLLGTVLFAVGPALQRYIRTHRGQDIGAAGSVAAILAVSIYGGYFNGGLGIMLLATFGLLGFQNLHGMNGLKNVLSALLSLVSAVAFIAAGLISWENALVVALAQTLGGYLGARGSRMISASVLRWGVTLVGAVMTLVFFLR